MLLLRNLDEVPQIFGPVLIMPGQSFRLPFDVASTYSFACTAHASGQMSVIVEPTPRAAAGNAALAAGARAETDSGIMNATEESCRPLAVHLPPLVVIAADRRLVDGRRATESAIFPTPWQVVTGTLELAQDGTLWEHIGASLFRVGTGFGLALLFAVPLGLWMGWVAAPTRTLNPIFQMLRPISPIAWIPIAILWFGVGDMSPIFLIFIASVFPDDRADHLGRAHDRAALPARGARNFGVSRAGAVPPACVIPGRAARDHRRHADRLGVAWLVVVAAEMIALQSGLGY